MHDLGIHGCLTIQSWGGSMPFHLYLNIHRDLPLYIPANVQIHINWHLLRTYELLIFFSAAIDSSCVHTKSHVFEYTGMYTELSTREYSSSLLKRHQTVSSHQRNPDPGGPDPEFYGSVSSPDGERDALTPKEDGPDRISRPLPHFTPLHQLFHSSLVWIEGCRFKTLQ